jgi:membrane protein YqaA with SNARE-associated domain
MQPRTRQILKSLVILLPVIAISVSIFIFQDSLRRFEAWGIPGIFLLSILASSTVIVPVPGFVLACTMSPVFTPLWVALATGVGAGLGEITGYLAGYSGQVVLEGRPQYERLVAWMRRYGVWAVLLLAFIPNPAFDMAGITAGTLKMPLAKFVLFCTLGKTLRMGLIALTCASGIPWLQSLITR